MTGRHEIKSETQTLQSGLRKRNEPLPGSCAYSIELARKLRGWVYITETPSLHGPDHKVAVSRIEKTTKGQVIDVTLEDPFIGQVSNVFDFKKTAEEIGNLYGVQG